MDAIRSEWMHLDAACTDPHATFQSFAWCCAWFASRGPFDRIAPHIVLASNSNGPLALLPMARVHRFGVSALRPLGQPHSQIGSTLADRGSDAHRALVGIVEACLATPGVDIVSFGPFAEGSPLDLALRQTGRMPVPDEADWISALDCTSFRSPDDYVAGLSKNRRRDRRRKLQSLGGEGTVRLRRFTGGDAGFARAAANALRLKRDWLRRTGTVSLALGDPATPAFFDVLARMQADAGATRIEVDELVVGDRVIAAALNLANERLRACYLCAYEPQWAAASPGTLLHQMGAMSTIEEGRESYSLIGYPTRFKGIWTDTRTRLLRHDHAITLKGKAWLTLWQHGLRPLAKKAVHLARPALARWKGDG